MEVSMTGDIVAHIPSRSDLVWSLHSEDEVVGSLTFPIDTLLTSVALLDAGVDRNNQWRLWKRPLAGDDFFNGLLNDLCSFPHLTHEILPAHYSRSALREGLSTETTAVGSKGGFLA